MLTVLLCGCGGRYTPEVFDPLPYTLDSSSPTAPLAEELETAVRARERGDFPTALRILGHLRLQGRASSEATYQLAVALEEAQLYSQAVGLYRELSREGSLERRNDAAFREALCLWQMDENRAAARALAKVRVHGALAFSDRLKLDLATGVSWMRTGKTRRGQKRIIEALNAANTTESVQFMRALAVYALMEHTLLSAAKLDLQVREKHQFRDLEKRVAMLRESEDHLRRIMGFAEIHWMLEGWLLLGDAYVSFATDLSQAPVPKGLSSEQASRYRSGLADQALPLRRKGLLAYDRGVEVAIRAGRLDLKAAQTLQSRLAESLETAEPNSKMRMPPQ
ncbi:MAG: hypothetical protein VXW32_03845 [Myxococcota bacterium]|nr:hypothetical protein [Myxococcota bacterium]